MKITLSKDAVKDIQKLNPKERKKLGRYVTYIKSAQSLYQIPQTQRIQGTKNMYRIKIHPYRIFVETQETGVMITRINPRGNAYGGKK